MQTADDLIEWLRVDLNSCIAWNAYLESEALDAGNKAMLRGRIHTAVKVLERLDAFKRGEKPVRFPDHEAEGEN